MSWWSKEFEDKKWTRIKINPKTEKYLWRVLILTLVDFSFISSPSPSWTENWMQSCNRFTPLLIPCNQMFHVSSASAMFSRSRTNKKIRNNTMTFLFRTLVHFPWMKRESVRKGKLFKRASSESFQALASKLREWKSRLKLREKSQGKLLIFTSLYAILQSSKNHFPR